MFEKCVEVLIYLLKKKNKKQKINTLCKSTKIARLLQAMRIFIQYYTQWEICMYCIYVCAHINICKNKTKMKEAHIFMRKWRLFQRQHYTLSYLHTHMYIHMYVHQKEIVLSSARVCHAVCWPRAYGVLTHFTLCNAETTYWIRVGAYWWVDE